MKKTNSIFWEAGDAPSLRSRRSAKKKTNWVAFFLGMATTFLFAVSLLGNRINRTLERQAILMEDQKRLLQREVQLLEEHLNREDKEEQQKAPISPWDVRQLNAQRTWKGTASYYSEAGCVGCRADLLMANGQRFDENAMTLAFNWLPLNTKVTVRNASTGISAVATITDTGGFGALGRIADLSKGLKEAIGCTDLCQVEVIK